MVGASNWVNRLKFDKIVKGGLFIKGTMDGKIQINNCKKFDECANMYKNFRKLGNWNVPFILFNGNRRVAASWTIGGRAWNKLHRHQQLFDVLGQYIET
jgi:hypothetical protein